MSRTLDTPVLIQTIPAATMSDDGVQRKCNERMRD